MVKSFLRVVEHPEGYALAWIEDGEEGAFVGDLHRMTEKESRVSRDTRECYLAECAARDSDRNLFIRVRGVYVWARKKDADAVRKAANLAIKTDSLVMPEWAKTALAEGWKPPKGWKP